MSATIRILNADFSPRLDLPIDWQAQSLSWKLPGGADLAIITGQAGDCDRFLFASYSDQILGCPLEVLSANGEVVWNGYIESVLYTSGQYRINRSLKDMYNRLIVRYPRPEAQASPLERWQTTAWLEDAASVTRFGRKEKLITISRSDPYLAQQTLSASFQAVQRFPSFKVSWQTQPVNWQLQIIARGWWQRLDWVLDNEEQGLISHLGGGKTNYPLGRLSSQSQLAQSFHINQMNFSAGQVSLRTAVVGQPVDTLQVAIHEDDNGKAGNLVSAAYAPDASLDGSWKWANWQLNPCVQLSDAATYWLVIKRSGALSSEAYYLLESDDGAGFAQGSLKRWDGSNWQPLPQDLRFCLASETDSVAQIGDMIKHIDQFPYLKGVLDFQLNGNRVYQRRELEQTCQQRIESWLQGLPKKSANLNQQRIVEIISLPREGRISLPLSTKHAPLSLINTPIPNGSQWLGSCIDHALTKAEKSFWVESVVWRKGKGISWKFSS